MEWLIKKRKLYNQNQFFVTFSSKNINMHYPIPNSLIYNS